MVRRKIEGDNEPSDVNVRKASDQVETSTEIETVPASPGATLESAPLTAKGVNLDEGEGEEVELYVPIKDANGIVIRYERKVYPREEYEEYKLQRDKAVAPLARFGAEAHPERAVVD